VEALHFFEDVRVWLTEDCAVLIAQFLEDLRTTFNRYDVLRQSAERFPYHEPGQRAANDAVMEAWDRLTGEPLTAARRALEAEMRRLLEPPRGPPDKPAGATGA